MSLPAVGWGISVAGWIMSPIISKLLDKVLSYCKSNKAEALRQLLTDVLPRLTLTLEAAEALNHIKLFEEMVRGLKSAFYDMEDILDELEYIRHQKKLDGQKSSKSKKMKKWFKITSDVVAGPSNQDICIEPSLTLTRTLNVRLKDTMTMIEELIVKAQGIIALAQSSSKGNTVTAKNIDTRITSAPVEMVTGRVEDRDWITGMLCDIEKDVNPSSSNNKCFSIIGIYGISGSGKTTLTQYVCKHEEDENYFDLVMCRGKVTADVRRDFNTVEAMVDMENSGSGMSTQGLPRFGPSLLENYSVCDIFKEMYESASVDKYKACPEYNSLDVLEKELEKKLDGKRFLLVLDDIWCNTDASQQQLPKLLSALKIGKKGSKILATSRSKDAFSDLGSGVARNVFPIRDLDDQVYLEMFMYYALEGANFDNPNDPDQIELRSIGAEIAQKLKGSPLAARTVGGQLRNKNNDVEFWKITRDRDLLNETTWAVWWSYQQLDEHIRRCFSYCSIFSRRYSLDRDELVKLWVAEGFIQTANPEEDLEVVGHRYFDELLATSFMQPGKSKYHGDKSCYIVHDLMYDLAEKVAGNDCFRIENVQRRSVPHDVRHLFVATEEIFKLKSLRTLIIHDTEWSKSASAVFFQKVFEKLRKLRILIITRIAFRAVNFEIPPTIGHLKHLRHLDFNLPVGSKLILPRTLTNLYHLQVLRCDRLNKFEFPPDIDMSKLSNLRHMSFGTPEFIAGVLGKPVMTLPNIARLTSLQTLDYFNVKVEHGYEIKQLRDLNKLQGCPSIQDLENVKSKNEALEANLVAKIRLTELDLFWNHGTASPEVQAEVLEGLCPPKGLKSLEIVSYRGLGYPSWMMGVQNGAPKYLNILSLKRCRHLGPAPELFECFIHLREFTIWDSRWKYLPANNMKDLRWLSRD